MGVSNKLDTSKNLFNFIKFRLPDTLGYGDSGKELVDGVSNHSVFQQNIREDNEGDVGIFEVSTTEQPKYSGYTCYISSMQVVVNTVAGDVDGAVVYLHSLLDNIRNNRMSEHIKITNCSLINIHPVGKNKRGIQWCVLNIKLKWIYTN